MKNKLAKKSYFIKRLRDSGYEIEKVFDKFSEADPRNWSIIINPGTASVFCTCYVNYIDVNEKEPRLRCLFELYDGGQYIPNRVKLETSSIEVLVSRLIKFGIYPSNEKANQQKR